MIAALAIHYQAGNITAAAEAVGVSRRCLRGVLQRSGLRGGRAGEGKDGSPEGRDAP